MKKEYIECGRIIAAHGVRGLIKAESWCDSTKVLATRKRVYIREGDEFVPHDIITASASPELVIMDIGITSREAAQGMKNTVLYLHRDDIPLKPGAVLLADLIGLPVIDAHDGKIYGSCADIIDGVQGKLYVVSTESGDVLIPERPEFIERTDPDSGIYITPIPGFFS